MFATSSRSVRRTGRLGPAIGLTCVLALAACGSDGDEPGDAESATEVGDDSSDAAESDPADASVDASEGGSVQIKVTVEDGTVYEFVDVSSCDTGVTDPSGLPSTGYDLTGFTADGEFRIGVGRAGFSDEETIFSGLLEGDFDDEGKNAKMIYTFSGIDGSEFVVDGANVDGSAPIRAIGPTRPHGDDTTVTIDADC